jgi:hypothetical protein
MPRVAVLPPMKLDDDAVIGYRVVDTVHNQISALVEAVINDLTSGLQRVAKIGGNLEMSS